MPMERVPVDKAISKPELHRRMREWLLTDEPTVGPVGQDRVTGVDHWIHVADEGRIYFLHADTPRAAVEEYLQWVNQYGEGIAWHVVKSQRGKETAVGLGPDKKRVPSLYLYTAEER